MPTYVIATGAEADLRAIAAYTHRTWGDAQAARYARAVERHFDALSAGAVRTKNVFASWSELQRSRCGRHAVFSIRRRDQPLLVLAVFHERMDLLTRLHERASDEFTEE